MSLSSGSCPSIIHSCISACLALPKACDGISPFFLPLWYAAAHSRPLRLCFYHCRRCGSFRSMPLRHLSAIHQNSLGHCESVDALTYTGHFCELTSNWIQRDSRVNQGYFFHCCGCHARYGCFHCCCCGYCGCCQVKTGWVKGLACTDNLMCSEKNSCPAPNKLKPWG